MRDAFEEKRDTKKKKRENRKEDDAGTKEKKSRFRRFPGEGYHRLRSTTPSTHAIPLFSFEW